MHAQVEVRCALTPVRSPHFKWQVKAKNNLDITFIGLDVMNKNEDRLLVQGDPARLYVKDQLRSLVDFKSRNKGQ